MGVGGLDPEPSGASVFEAHRVVDGAEGARRHAHALQLARAGHVGHRPGRRAVREARDERARQEVDGPGASRRQEIPAQPAEHDEEIVLGDSARLGGKAVGSRLALEVGVDHARHSGRAEDRLLVDLTAPLRARERDLHGGEVTAAQEEGDHRVVVVDSRLERAGQVQLQGLERVGGIPRGIVHLDPAGGAERLGHRDHGAPALAALPVADHVPAIARQLGAAVLPVGLERRDPRRGRTRGRAGRDRRRRARQAGG